jgi:hypothetical protein
VTEALPPQTRPPANAPLWRRAALYPEQYTWYVFLSSLDLLFTWRILIAGGTEVNSLADWIIDRHDVPGMVGFKLSLVVIVVIVCEIVGRFRPTAGAKLARWAVVISAFPVVIGGLHLLRIALGVRGYPGAA